MQEIGHYLE